MASRSLRSTERWWFSVAILGPALAALAVTAAATLAFVLWTAQGVDQRSLERQNDLARKVIAVQLNRVPHDQQSVTVWDDAITHTKLSFDATWVDVNLGSWMHSYFGHDEVVILDDKDRPIYDMLSGGPTPLRHAEAQLHDLMPFVATLRAQIAAGAIDRYQAGTDPKPPSLSDLAVINGVPMLVSVSPLISDSGAISQAPGTEYLHISMVYLDAALAHRITDEYSIAAARFTRYAVTQPDEATLPVTNRAGRFITFFNWRVQRPGEDIFRQSLPVLAIGFLIALAVTGALLYQLWRKSRALDRGRADAEHQARHDPLTHLPNRQHFEAALARALAQRPNRERRTTILMLDLDRFKQVNDTLGHHAGDDLIEAVGQRLRQLVDPDDFLARLGGDEFAILTTDAPGLLAPLRLSHRVIEAIGKPFEIFGSEAFVGVSIGVATADGNEADARELIRKGDIALYEAKTTGRNRAVVFEESMNELLQNRHTIEAELREALRRADQLSVDFQPLFGADRTQIVGAEALARWRHPRLGLVSPAHFIPVAEASGLIGALGDFVLRRACEMGARWPGRVIAANISPAQLRDPGFPERVFKLLSETRMRPADLELEITEGILLEDASTASEAIRIFRSAGIRIALDDFGTGYSSLNYLKRYPVDRIKIDRSFVSQLAPGSVSNAIVQAMVTLAHALKIEVTAEGVETEEQMDVLIELGCNVFQGFLLSPPVSADSLETRFHTAAATPPVEARVA